MSLLQQITTNYDSAFNELKSFKEFDYPEVVAEYERLQANLEEARLALIDYAKQNKVSVKTDNNQFNFVQPFKRWYDVKTCLDLAKELGCSREVNECIEIETKVNMEKLDELVEAGKIPLDIRVKAYHEEPLSPRVNQLRATNQE